MNVYIEAHFKQVKENEYQRVEVMIAEDLVPLGVHRFLTARYGEITDLSFHFTREAEDCSQEESECAKKTVTETLADN